MNREELLKNAKPIIFSTSMVKAILDGKKTQTRRVIKIDDTPENWKISIAGTSIVRAEPYDVKLPRYAAGDILWVRETWNYSPNWYYCYKADVIPDDNHGYIGSIPWRPSIHMPKEAARIFLKVTDVRVERLQDITEEDCIAEGIKPVRVPGSTNYREEQEFQIACGIATIEKYEELWDSTIKKQDLDKYSWEDNPWVWVIEFERVDVENERKEMSKVNDIFQVDYLPDEKKIKINLPEEVWRNIDTVIMTRLFQEELVVEKQKESEGESSKSCADCKLSDCYSNQELIDEIEALQKENNGWQERYYELDAGHSRLFKDFCKLQKENEQLRAQMARMRKSNEN